MHEEAMLRDLRRKLVEVGRTESVDRFSVVRLWVGALAHTSETTLRDRWPTTVAGTPAEGSRLDVERSDDVHDPRAGGIVLVRVEVPPVSTTTDERAPAALEGPEGLRARPE
ncbi:MAG: hydrogenase maturation nickel metallochaperone HypA [Thermoplasmata archaeon]|nr:hydrogenase maturation nickel metallochaperone HypA [Thermoplasmata archaeon]MCI4361778.1 hydrogenase maturation nickel metallochaperone HypA [Thermoplasmata archaeon]